MTLQNKKKSQMSVYPALLIPDFEEPHPRELRAPEIDRHAQREDFPHQSRRITHRSGPFDERFTQQDGFLHAGVVTTLMDSAGGGGGGCGYAAYTLMPDNSRVLSVEFKVNLLSPAVGKGFRAEGRVVKSGKTISVCEGKLFAILKMRGRSWSR